MRAVWNTVIHDCSNGIAGGKQLGVIATATLTSEQLTYSYGIGGGKQLGVLATATLTSEQLTYQQL